MEKEKSFFEVLEYSFTKNRNGWITFFALGFLFVLFSTVSLFSTSSATRVYFLSVGQGDSELIETNGVRILIDGGPPNGRAAGELGKLLPFWDKRIDIIFLTHPELDHFGGLTDVARQFTVHTFISSGAENDNEAFRDFSSLLDSRAVRKISVSSGDIFLMGSSILSVLSPRSGEKCSATNECALVLLFSSQKKSVLFTADIPDATEKELLPAFSQIDILKVAHHGSRFSTSELFLLKTLPKVAFIEVGKNSFGHPTPETLERLKKFAIPTFRTDEKGTLGVNFNTSPVRVFSLE